MTVYAPEVQQRIDNALSRIRETWVDSHAERFHSQPSIIDADTALAEIIERLANELTGEGNVFDTSSSDDLIADFASYLLTGSSVEPLDEDEIDPDSTGPCPTGGDRVRR